MESRSNLANNLQIKIDRQSNTIDAAGHKTRNPKAASTYEIPGRESSD